MNKETKICKICGKKYNNNCLIYCDTCYDFYHNLADFLRKNKQLEKNNFKLFKVLDKVIKGNYDLKI